MASIKNRKSKSKGVYGVAGVAGSKHGPASDYDYRRAEFAGQPPAITVRPLRALKAWVNESASALYRATAAAMQAFQGDATKVREATQQELRVFRARDSKYKLAHWFAAQGTGRVVVHLSNRYAGVSR